MKLLDHFMCTVLDRMKEAVVGLDANGKIILLNKKAQELLEIDYETSIGNNIDDIVENGRLIKVMENGIPEYDKDFEYNNKKFIVDRIPIVIDEEVIGALALFNDITELNKMSKRISEDEGYIEILNTILDTVNEWVVVVDENGMIQMMSKAYKEFWKDSNPEGKHVTDVIDNTRMHIVAKTGIREVGDIQEIQGNKMIAMRIPIKKNGKIVGAVGKTMFKDIEDFMAISKKVNDLEKELEYYKKEFNNDRVAKYSFDDIIGEGEKIENVKNIAKRVANSNSSVIITGESGTGKELFAHAIHNSSSRRLGPFVRLNCAAIPADLLESELFGYEEGAFTGAKKGGKKGKFELANGGTILLDEIGDMPLSMQAKLLRVLQEKEFERVGGNTVNDLDVRVLASTNKDLKKMVEEKTFREDFYYRLNVVTLKLPPLRERREDIEELTTALKNKLAKRLGIYVEGISKEALTYLKNYNWPGNVRELENIIERAINLLDTELVIKPHHLPIRITKNKEKYSFEGNKKLKNILEDVEKEVIIDALEKNQGNKNQTSKALGISRVSLYKKLDKYSIKDV